MSDQIRTPLDIEFFGKDAQGGVRGDEVNGLHTRITLDGEQQSAEKDGSTGAGSRDGQILRWEVRQSFSGEAGTQPRTLEHRE